MSAFRRSSRVAPCQVLAVIASVLLGAPTARTVGAQAGHQPTPVGVMQEFARTFAGLEGALADSDGRLWADHVSALGRASSVPDVWRAQGGEAEHGALERLLGALREATAALPTKLDSSSRAEAAGALEHVRRACVRCHSQFRAGDVQRNYYPATRNTIAGRVDIQRVGTGGVRRDRSGVAVFIEGGPADALPSTRRPAPSISQRNRRFAPRVVPVTKGSLVHFPNDDDVFHNVFSRSEARAFDLGLYAQGLRRSVEFPNTGLVKVYCNIHPDMALSVLVLGNGYFDVTDADGLFAITDVPDGSYVLRAWHEFGGATREPITISGGALRRVSVRIEETRKSIEHLNKFGQPYGGKY